MPYKNKDKQKEAQAKHYNHWKPLYKERSKERRIKNRKWIDEYKSKCKCQLCEENRPACLVFHHIDPSTKHKSITEMICNGSTLEKIQSEIAKCQVLCSNCHLVHHHGNRWDCDSNILQNL